MNWRAATASWPALLHRLRRSRPWLLWGCALLLVGAALLLQWRVLPPMREALAVLQAQAEARALLREPPAPWPAARLTPFRTEQLLNRARREGLRIDVLSERPEPASASHSVELRAVGGYGSLRRYLAYALAEDPALALESLRLQRPASRAAAIDGLQLELRWRLLYQPGSDN